MRTAGTRRLGLIYPTAEVTRAELNRVFSGYDQRFLALERQNDQRNRDAANILLETYFLSFASGATA